MRREALAAYKAALMELASLVERGKPGSAEVIGTLVSQWVPRRRAAAGSVGLPAAPLTAMTPPN
eukprot:COSAG01_NODE_2377_length_7801_cov_4.201117_6_plen_64_part_00